MRDPLHVVTLAYDGLRTFEFASMVELFGLPRPEFDVWYRHSVAAIEPGPLRAMGGVQIDAPYTLRMVDRAGTIILPGWRGPDAPVPAPLARALVRAHDDGARIASVCSGAFALAACGLLDGRRATTHWMEADRLARQYPKVDVDPDVLYVVDGRVITAAGSAAGLDMGLAIIRDDFGAAVANTVARRLVIPPHRAGGQQQFVEPAVAPSSQHRADDFNAFLDHLRVHVADEHTVESMADAAGCAPRTFARRFHAVTGITPHRWLQRERVRLAQSLLETTDDSIESVAHASGFSDAQLLRLHFKRELGTTPSAFRRTFHGQAADRSAR